MNKFLFWGAALFLVVGAWFVGRYSVKDSEAVEPAVAAEQVTTNDSEQARVQLKEKIDALEKSISALKKEKAGSNVAQQETVVEDARSMPDPPAPGSMVNSPVVSSDASAGTPIDTTKITSLPDRFASEPVDTNWAPSQAQELQNQLLVAEAFQEQNLGVVECKSTTCRIEFNAETKQQQLNVGSKLAQFVMQKQSGKFEPNVMVRPSEKAGVTSFYIGRAEAASNP